MKANNEHNFTAWTLFKHYVTIQAINGEQCQPVLKVYNLCVSHCQPERAVTRGRTFRLLQGSLTVVE